MHGNIGVGQPLLVKRRSRNRQNLTIVAWSNPTEKGVQHNVKAYYPSFKVNVF